MHHQFMLLGDDEGARAVVHDFAAFLHERPGARRVWFEREVGLKKNRAILHPEVIALASTYVDVITADFEVLDRSEN